MSSVILKKRIIGSDAVVSTRWLHVTMVLDGLVHKGLQRLNQV